MTRVLVIVTHFQIQHIDNGIEFLTQIESRCTRLALEIARLDSLECSLSFCLGRYSTDRQEWLLWRIRARGGPIRPSAA